MAGHFQAIGFELPDEDAFDRLIQKAVSAGESRTRGDGGATVVWRDRSGASLAVHLDDAGTLVCGAPSFLAHSAFPVRVNGVALDPECRFCSTLVVDVLDAGEMLYPLAVQLENIDEALERESNGGEHKVALTAFAEDVEVWTDEDSYAAAATSEPQLAPESLIPSGLFGAEGERRGFLRRRRPATPPQAQALITGIVKAADTLRNETSGSEFVHARVATYGPTLDVVLAPGDLPSGLAGGNVVQGSFWLIGRLEL